LKKIRIDKHPSKEKLEELDVEKWGTWECEPSTFPWEYDSTETCYILEGKAKVTADEEEVEFGKGDLVVLPEGLKCERQVIDKIRKYYRFS